MQHKQLKCLSINRYSVIMKVANIIHFMHEAVPVNTLFYDKYYIHCIYVYAFVYVSKQRPIKEENVNRKC